MKKTFVTARTTLMAFLIMFGVSAGVDTDRLGQTMATAMVFGAEAPVAEEAVADRSIINAIREQREADAAARAEEEAAAAALPAVDNETLWLARVIYSETKRPYEQELVAWTVRNRVETGYRGQTTYRGVVLDPWQFSAFNANGPKRGHYVGLGETSAAKGWATAVAIAYDVVRAPAYERPFAQDTRHFYSEVSMVGRSHPAWATGKRPVSLDREIDPKRFRFFRAIA
jgi:hypothetical protein